MIDERFSRQCKVAEIGQAGQERLRQAMLVVPRHEGALIEALYLHRAGVEHLRLDAAAPPPPFAHVEHFTHPATRRLASAAWGALDQMRRALGVDAG